MVLQQPKTMGQYVLEKTYSGRKRAQNFNPKMTFCFSDYQALICVYLVDKMYIFKYLRTYRFIICMTISQSYDNMQNQQNEKKEGTILISIKEQGQNNFYKLIEELGLGGFGVVYLACKNMNYAYLAAVKLIKKPDKENKKTQINLLEKSQDSQQIVKIIDQVKPLNKNQKIKQMTNTCFVMQYCESSLKAQINHRQNQKQQNLFSFQEIIFTISQLSKGIKYLHSKNIMHRDIDPSNILLHMGYLKITDFGIAKQILSTNKTRCGKPYYMAPEIIFELEKGEQGEQGQGHTELCDIWSIGMVFTDLLNIQIMPKKSLYSIQNNRKEMKILLQKIQKKTKQSILRRLKAKEWKTEQIQLIKFILDATLQQKPKDRKTAADLVAFIDQAMEKKFPGKAINKLNYYISQSVQKRRDLTKKTKETQEKFAVQKVHSFQINSRSPQTSLIWSVTLLRDVYATILQLKQNILNKSSSQYKQTILYLTFIVSKIFQLEHEQFVKHEFSEQNKSKSDSIKKDNQGCLNFKGKRQSEDCKAMITQQKVLNMIKQAEAKSQYQTNQQRKIYFAQLLQNKQQKLDQKFPKFDSENEQQRIIRAFLSLFAVFAKRQAVIQESGQIVLKGLKCFVNCQQCKNKTHEQYKLCRIVNWIIQILQKYISDKKFDNFNKYLSIPETASQIILSLPQQPFNQNEINK